MTRSRRSEARGAPVGERDGRLGAHLGVVVVAAGSGERLGSGNPKALVPLAGRSLLAHALAGLASAGLPPAVVVHTPGAAETFALAAGDLPIAALVPGGATRTASVAAGVAALPPSAEVVVIHDAARPLTPPEVIGAAVAAVTDGVDVLAAAPGIPVADTLKRTEDGQVLSTVDRSGLVGVQTPQVFPRHVLDRVLSGVPSRRPGADAPPLEAATDDLGLVERLRDRGVLDGRILVVPGSIWARKVTYPADLALLELLAEHDAPVVSAQGPLGQTAGPAGSGATTAGRAGAGATAAEDRASR
ncbi:MAG: 2-C-methyl-D-erythritol 4-phosphate cytidylyltransferase [Nitriliruptoraceae bacterium]